MSGDRLDGQHHCMEIRIEVTEFPLSRLDPDKSSSFDPLAETIALPNNKQITVEMVQDGCRFRFFDNEWEPELGQTIEISRGRCNIFSTQRMGKVV